MKSKFFLTATMAAVAGTMLLSSLGTAQNTPSQASQLPMTQSAEVELLDDLFIGAEDAPVTLIEYASFTCVHCATFAEDVLPTIKAEYVDTGKVKFAMREAYMDKYGLWAGMVAHAFSEDRTNAPRYYAFVDALFAEQDTWVYGASNETEIADNLRAMAVKSGMSAEDVEAALNDEATTLRLVENFSARSQEDGVQGTPSFVINGEVHRNMDLDAFRSVLDAAVADAS